MTVILAIVFFLIFMLFQSVSEAIVLILPTVYAMTGGLLLRVQYFHPTAASKGNIMGAVGYIRQRRNLDEGVMKSCFARL